MSNIINPYLENMKNIAIKRATHAYVILDRVISITAEKFPNAEIKVDEIRHIFFCDVNSKFALNISVNILGESVLVVAGTEDSVFAQIDITTNGPSREEYNIIPGNIRRDVRGYFNELGDIEIPIEDLVSQSSDVASVVESEEEVVEEPTEIHFVEGDSNE